MTATSPPDDAVRRKAYELWEARGRPHGSDKEDWSRAKDLLTEREPNRGLDPLWATQVLTKGVLGIASAAISAATQTVEQIFGSLDPKASKTAASASSEATSSAPEAALNEALTKAERTLQLETDKRIRETALEANAVRTPDQP